jgi:hypothetical protein
MGFQPNARRCDDATAAAIEAQPGPGRADVGPPWPGRAGPGQAWPALAGTVRAGARPGGPRAGPGRAKPGRAGLGRAGAGPGRSNYAEVGTCISVQKRWPKPKNERVLRISAQLEHACSNDAEFRSTRLRAKPITQIEE